jgi:foldase protein PrsA
MQDKPEETSNNVQSEGVEETTTSVQEEEQAFVVAPAPSPKFRGSWVWIGISTLLLVALVFMFLRDGQADGMGKVVGEAEGVTITEADLYDEMIQQLGTQPGQIVDAMITTQLISIEADKANVSVSDADIEAELDEIKKDFATEEEFEAALKQYNLTLDALKKQMNTQVQIEKIFKTKINPDEATLKKYFEDNQAAFGTPEQVRASHILLGTKEEAEEVLAQLNNGGDFVTLAKEKSTDPGSKDKGGDLDYFGRGVMHAEFEEATFALNVGETSGVVESPSGFHIIRLVDKKAATTPTFEESKKLVEDRYMDEQLQTEVPAWIEKVKKDANVTNTLAVEAAPVEAMLQQ